MNLLFEKAEAAAEFAETNLMEKGYLLVNKELKVLQIETENQDLSEYGNLFKVQYSEQKGRTEIILVQ